MRTAPVRPTVGNRRSFPFTYWLRATWYNLMHILIKKYAVMGKILYLNSNHTSSNWSNVGFKSIAHCHLLANNRSATNRHSLHEIRTHLWAWNINSLELNLNETTFYLNYLKKVFFYIYLNKQLYILRWIAFLLCIFIIIIGSPEVVK